MNRTPQVQMWLRQDQIIVQQQRTAYRRGLVHGILWSTIPWASFFGTALYLMFK